MAWPCVPLPLVLQYVANYLNLSLYMYFPFKLVVVHLRELVAVFYVIKFIETNCLSLCF